MAADSRIKKAHQLPAGIDANKRVEYLAYLKKPSHISRVPRSNHPKIPIFDDRYPDFLRSHLIPINLLFSKRGDKIGQFLVHLIFAHGRALHPGNLPKPH